MDRLLITGGSGLLGSTLAKRATTKFNVATTYLTRSIDLSDVECIQIDLTDERQYDILEQFAPDVVIHCAALTDVDRCERDPDIAEMYNVEMARNVARLASDLNARLVHISTDAVFDGQGHNYMEDDEPAPINVYGRTKLDAESAVQDCHEDSVIVRTNIYGWNATDGQSLAEWMISKLRRGETLPAFKDAYFTPIYTRDLTSCLLELIECNITGTLHVAGQERCSKMEFAYTLADVFNLDNDYIDPVSIGDIDFDAPRGADLSLSVERAQERLDCLLPTVREGLEHMRRDEP